MKSRSTVDVTITLEMNLQEARWLQTVLENPLRNQTPDEEYPTEKQTRLNFFNSLKDQTENHA